jgi:hypothetical protein
MLRRIITSRLIVALFTGRFEPIEAVLSLSSIVHGVWLLFPYWTVMVDGSVSGAPRIYEQLLGAAMVVAGVVHLIGQMGGKRTFQLRKQASFIKFLLWGFLTWLALLATTASSVIWVPYATIMLVSAFVYLNVSVGVSHGAK